MANLFDERVVSVVAQDVRAFGTVVRIVHLCAHFDQLISPQIYQFLIDQILETKQMENTAQ